VGEQAASKEPAAKANSKATARAKAKPTPPKKPRLPGPDEVRHWVGMRVDGVGNRTIGRVAGIHVDAEDGQPRWAAVRLGPLKGCTAIPFEHVAEGAGRLWAGYERDWVREAPRFRANEALTADNELELCAHWGIRDEVGRAAEVLKHGNDEITAVPATD
jgi:hypothetical protein